MNYAFEYLTIRAHDLGEAQDNTAAILNPSHLSPKKFLREIPMQCVRAGLLTLLLATLAAAQNQFVYTNNQSSPNTISGFIVNSDGSLAQIPGPPFAGSQDRPSPTARRTLTWY